MPQHCGRDNGASHSSAGCNAPDRREYPLAAGLCQRRRIARRLLPPHSVSGRGQGRRPQEYLGAQPPSAPGPAGAGPPAVRPAGFPRRDRAPARKLVRAEPVSTWDQLVERSRGRVSRPLVDVGLPFGGRSFRRGLPLPLSRRDSTSTVCTSKRIFRSIFRRIHTCSEKPSRCMLWVSCFLTFRKRSGGKRPARVSSATNWTGRCARMAAISSNRPTITSMRSICFCSTPSCCGRMTPFAISSRAWRLFSTP